MSRFDDPAFVSQLRETLREASRDRLHRTESALATVPLDARIAFAEWGLNVATSPPLNSKGWEAERAILTALCFDIYDLTRDPDDALGITPHPTLVALFREWDMLP